MKKKNYESSKYSLITSKSLKNINFKCMNIQNNNNMILKILLRLNFKISQFFDFGILQLTLDLPLHVRNGELQ